MKLRAALLAVALLLPAAGDAQALASRRPSGDTRLYGLPPPADPNPEPTGVA